MDGASLCERRNGMRLEHEDRWLSDRPGRQEQAAEADAPKVKHGVPLKSLLAIERDDNVGLPMITAWMALRHRRPGARPTPPGPLGPLRRRSTPREWSLFATPNACIKNA